MLIGVIWGKKVLLLFKNAKMIKGISGILKDSCVDRVAINHYNRCNYEVKEYLYDIYC